MTTETRGPRVHRLAWSLAVVALASMVAGILLQEVRGGGRDGGFLESLGLFLGFASFPVLGALVLSRDSKNKLGWVFLIIGLSLGIGFLGGEYAQYGVVKNPGSLPWATVGAWLDQWYWFLVIGPLFTFGLLLFPDGRLPSPRWRPLGWACAGIFVVLVGGSMLEERLVGAGYDLPNPIGIHGLGDVEESWGPVMLFAGICGLLCAVSLIVRYRRSRGDERQQLKWFTYAGSMFIVVALAEDFAGVELPGWVFSIQLLALPVAIGIAILKYRLYDIDVVINKTIVFGALAAFITGIYVAIVVGVGMLLGSQDEPNLALSIAATAIVAIAFSPVKERTQRLANRLVYGQRATPYEALHRFTDEVATSYETDRVAPAMAKTIVDATGAERAEVWLALDHTLVRAAAEPGAGGASPEAISIAANMTVTHIEGADVTSPVIHNNELLGALTLTKKRGEAPSPVDNKLLDDLAAQAGIVLRNSRLTAELRARLDQITRTATEIRESRQRIVAAQDKARRTLERDIHDGAQQHLVALAVKLNLAKTMATKKPERAEAMLVQLKDEATDALDTLDELAQGIYPPVLAEHGIAKAIETRVDKTPFALHIADEIQARFEPHVEAAAYFCILEALQNVAKYANATTATVAIKDEDGDLSFTVIDDGAGFDPATTDYGTGIQGMSDRLAAVGGTVDLTSAPGAGTTVTGRLTLHLGSEVGAAS
jgi:signal transduction histidine kinase